MLLLLSAASSYKLEIIQSAAGCCRAKACQNIRSAFNAMAGKVDLLSQPMSIVVCVRHALVSF
jgi:hypothetical protein